MTPEGHARVALLFARARALAPGERATFLDRVCASDGVLRAEVESLLACGEQPDSFLLDKPVLEAGVLPEPDAALAPGSRLGPYEILARIGAGGMGEVYRAKDPRLRREVAIKILPPTLSGDEERLRRFAQEACAAGSLSHPNILSVYDVGTHGGAPYLVSELLEGQTLRERLGGRALPMPTAVEYGAQIARGLAAAHEKGVVHRDLKPENLFITNDGRVKIFDFGLAKLTAPVESDVGDPRVSTLENLTGAGVVMGTVSYMSPEQARGEPVDQRSDVFSFGVVLYEMLTGENVFRRDSPIDALHAIIHDDPPLSGYASGVPAALEDIVRTCLEKDRERRYASSRDLAVDLETLRSEHEPARRVAPRATAVAADPRGRRRTLHAPRPTVVLVGLLLTLIVATLGYALVLRAGYAVPVPEIKSLAVLPMENLSGDSSQEYFADGMTEALITDLAKLGALRVTSRPSVMRYKGTHTPVREIARELGVDAVIVGSVARSGDRARITVQLIHAGTERSLWADSYERDLRDVLALQQEVARSIANEIRIKLTPQEQERLAGARPVNPEAYDDYLRGRYYASRQNQQDNEAAIRTLERSVSADPNFASAHAELALAYVWRFFLFTPKEKQWEENAFVEVEKALALDPDSAVAHLARARLLWTPANHFPHGEVIQECRRALALNPNLDEAQSQLALVYGHIGAFDEALQILNNALSNNPGNNLVRYRIAETLQAQGRHEQAWAILRTLPREVQPALVGYQSALALYNLGRREEAAAMLEELLRANPEDSGGLFTSMQAILAASAGEDRSAEEKIERAVELGKGFGHFHHTAYNVACAYSLMNKPKLAITWLEAAAEDGFPCYPLFESDPKLAALRREPRFMALMTSLEQQGASYRSPL